MVQRIVTFCDVHSRNEEEVPAQTWQVTVQAPGESRPTAWEVDLCEEDAKTLRDLGVMLGAVGTQTDGPRRSKAAARQVATPAAVRAPADLACPVDGCEATPLNDKALQSHLRHNHDGLTKDEALGRPRPFVCPECDRAFGRAQGLGAHRRQAHGVFGAQTREGQARAS